MHYAKQAEYPMDNNQPKRIAVIDLGSNTTRLIIMETKLGFSYRLVDEVREVARLRQGLTSKGLMVTQALIISQKEAWAKPAKKMAIKIKTAKNKGKNFFIKTRIIFF